MKLEIMNGSGCKVLCPKFDHCSAPICPIDPEWQKRVHIKGDPVCFYLRQHAKDPLWGRKAVSVASKLIDKVGEVYLEVIARYGPLKTALVRAEKSPVKGFLAHRGECRNGFRK